MARASNAPARPARRRVPQQARSRRTRERILAAAVDCFEHHGYDDTTTAMIAARAGIGVGTLYGYFPDKRELLLTLFGLWSTELADVVLRGLDPERWAGGDVREHTRELIDTLFHMQTLRPGIQRVLWERYFKDPDFHAPFERVRERLRCAVVDFARAIGPAQLRDGLDVEGAALIVVNAVQWNAVHAYMHGTPAEIDAAARNTAEMVERFLFRD
ncbi:MAG: helix-turn-helix domain-containing protein [Myxococcota bacterium]|nr:TetR/AcrR family transcriptional regulator [Myxococcales bacterium]